MSNHMHAPVNAAEAPSQLPAQNPASMIPSEEDGVHWQEVKSIG